jgi:hypothetical protein
VYFHKLSKCRVSYPVQPELERLGV